MAEETQGQNAFDRPCAGRPIKLDRRTLQPVARITGSTGAWSEAGGVWLRTRPIEVLVTDEDGRTYRVPITVQRNDTVRWLALAGALVLPLNWLVRRALRSRHWLN